MDKTKELILLKFSELSKAMPVAYLKRNHLQYEFISYLSLVTTLFLSDNFDGSGVFIVRYREALNKVGVDRFDANFLKLSQAFLDFVQGELMRNNRLTSEFIVDNLK